MYYGHSRWEIRIFYYQALDIYQYKVKMTKKKDSLWPSNLNDIYFAHIYSVLFLEYCILDKNMG